MEENNQTQQNPMQGNVDQQSMVQQSVSAQPQESLGYVQAQESPRENGFFRTKWKIILGLFLVIFLLFITATVLFAYDKLPIKNQELQDKIANVLMSIPFMPKTPRYVLEKSSEAHLKITKFSFDASIAADSNSFSSLTGSDKFDAQVKGKIDYSDINKPLAKFNVQLTKEFGLDILTKDQVGYFRINKIPGVLSAMMIGFGISEDIQNMVVGKWVMKDVKPLDTEARAILEKNAGEESIVQKQFENYLKAFANRDILSRLTMKEEKNDGLNEYHINFSPDDKTVDMFWEEFVKEELQKTTTSEKLPSDYKISDNIKNIAIDMWIDKKTYLIQKSTLSFNIESSSSSSTIDNPIGMIAPTQAISVAIGVKFSDFDKAFTVEVPKNAVDLDDLMKDVMSQYMLEVATRSGKPNLLNQPNQLVPVTELNGSI